MDIEVRRRLVGHANHILSRPTTKKDFLVSIKAANTDKMIVTGEVYAPYVIDTYGHFMEPDEVEELCYSFMKLNLQRKIDVQHDNRSIEAVAVESFIARGHPDYNEGAWVVSVKIDDAEVWKDIKSGKLAGYSMQAIVRPVPVQIEYMAVGMSYGFTEDSDGHTHAFIAKLDDNGVIRSGRTSYDNGHSHEIKYGTATELSNGHKHRYFI